MAEKGWTAQVAAAAGVAAGTGAAQLGLGYGLGVVEWPAVPADDSVWLGSLGWATWIAASSTVFGAVIADRLGRAVGGAWRFALAVSAAVGGLLTVALIALPARAAVRTETFSPQTIAGGYAVIGVLLGLFIAYWAVVSRPVAANLIATAAWLWSLAAAAVVTTIFWHRPSATYLSSWQFFSPDTADGQYGIIVWPSALLTLLAAFALGMIGALPAMRRGELGVGTASSGAVGPLLVAAAFFVLAPQLNGTPGPLQSAYLIAPYAVLAGLAGSALVVALGQRQGADPGQVGSGSRRSGAPGAAVAHDATDASGGDARTAAAATAAAGTASGDRPARPLRGRAKRPTGSENAGAANSPATGSATSTSSPATGNAGSTSRPATGNAGPTSRPSTGSAGSTGSAPSGNAGSTGSGRPGTAGSTGSGDDRTAGDGPVGRAGSGNAAGSPATAVVPSPRPAPNAEPELGPDRPRKSFMDRFRRKSKSQDEAPAGVTGRAKAPASAIPSTTAAARGESPSATSPAAEPSATPPRQTGKSPSARTPSAGSDGGARPASSSTPGRARSGAASVDGGARPAGSSAPGRSDSRSTVAPPPASPPIAKINDPQSGEKSPPPRKSAARPSRNPAPGPANAVGSDKTPAARKTPAKTTKSTAGPVDADTAELPVQDPKQRGARRPGDDQTS